MNHFVAVCFVIALMFVLVSMTHVPEMPRCPFCGKTREHAKDCSAKR